MADNPTTKEYIAALEAKLANVEAACKQLRIALSGAKQDSRRLNAMIEGKWAIHTFSGNNFKLYEVCAEGGYGKVLSRHEEPRAAIDLALRVISPTEVV